MVYDHLSGTWTYRSFGNRPELMPEIDPEHASADDLKPWSAYMFGQGLMVLHTTVAGGLTGKLKMGTAQSPLDMDLHGKIEMQDGVTWVRWNASGIAGTPSDGWLYEYDGCLTTKWADNGARQVDAIVGTVIRSQPHDDLAPNQTRDRAARAGMVASFIMVRNQFVEARYVLPLPPVMLELVGSEHHRLHHALWHGLRDFWVSPGDGNISHDEKIRIEQLGWKPPRPNQVPTRGTISSREPDNGAGEDFLFMHRHMILQVNGVLKNSDLPVIAGWTSIPPPNRDSRNLDGFSVPPAWDTGRGASDFKGLAMIKSDEYWASRMTFLERQFKNSEYLATLSLDQLGAKIEWLIHNLMHIRWCSQTTDPENPAIPLPGGRPLADRSQKWIKTSVGGADIYFDDLNEPFASHVHPIFWRLHGWVDDRIEDWYRAHEAAHPGKVQRADYMGVTWFAPGDWVAVSDPWVGPMELLHQHDHHDDRNMIETMRTVYDLIFAPADRATALARNNTFVQKLHRSAKVF